MPKIPRHPLSVLPDPRDGWFYNSFVGEHLAEERSESEEFIRMRRWDAHRMIGRDTVLPALGMPKLSIHQMVILRLILICGLLVEGQWTWAALRGHRYLYPAIANEIRVDRRTIATAMPLLREHDLVSIGEAYGTKRAISLAEGFHRYCFEAQWRETLCHSTSITIELVRKHGWKWLLERVDDAFRKRGTSPTNKQNRVSVLEYVRST